MNKVGKSKLQLEILVSTKNKNSLDFLNKMFSKCDDLDFKILIVNQVTGNIKLSSNNDNIRIINSNEKGISKSRNLAIKNAIGDICLFTDDDVIFESKFNEIILKAFEEKEGAGLLVFKALDFKGNNYRLYPFFNKKLDIKSVKGVLSIEIAFRRKIILKNNILFNERFGLGSEFETGEEYLFSRDVIKKNIVVFYISNSIVSHDSYNSGKDLGENRIIYARAALNYSIHGLLAYFWILKYIIFLLKNKYIVPNQILTKIKIAIKGINDFKRHDKIN